MTLKHIFFLGLSFAATVASQAAELGEPVPQCPAHLSESQTALDFGRYKGKVLLVDFWATWCGPCQKSMPFLNQLRNELQAEGFEIIAINVDEDSDEARRFLQTRSVDYPILFDPQGKCPSAFGVKAMPSSFFVDKTGKVRKIHLGFRETDQSEIRDQIAKLLAE